MSLKTIVLSEYNKNHDNLGRFSSGSSSGGGSSKVGAKGKKVKSTKGGYLDPKTRAEYIKNVTKYTKDNGGVTVGIDSAKNMPKEGLSFSPHPEAETIISKANLNEKTMLEFVKKHRSKLTQKDKFIGGWYNSDDGNYYLDIAQVGGYSPKTIAKAQKAEQLAIFDLKTYNEITIGTRTKKGYKPNAKATTIYEQNFGTGNGRAVVETFTGSVSKLYLGARQETQEDSKYNLATIVISEYNKNHDSLGRFSSSNSSGVVVDVGSNLSKSNSIGKKLTSEEITAISNRAVGNDKKKEALLEKHLEDMKVKAKTQQTIQLYSKTGKNGVPVWTEERKQLHKQILQDIFKDQAKYKPKTGSPTMIMLGGRGGSGKSNFEKGKKLGVYDRDKYLALNADDIKPYFKEYVPRLAYLTHEESSYLFKKAYRQAKRKGLNVVLDITMEKSKTNVLREFNKEGYKTQAHFISTTPKNAIDGAIKRYANGENVYNPLTKKTTFFKDGRLVPPQLIAGSTKNEINFDAIATRTNDGWSLSSRDENFNFTKIASGSQTVAN